MTLAFDESTHTYTYEGRRVPSVTQVIREVVLGGHDRPGMEWYMARGSALHLAAQMWDEGELDEESIDPAIAGHLAAYRRFRDDVGDDLTITEIEKPRYHTSGYAGTPDRVVEWRGDRGILDLKTGSTAAWHRLQTAAYAALAPEATARLVVYLGEDSRWKMDRHKDRSDWTVFSAALAVWRWRERTGALLQ